jgi:hypothetical protein
MSDLAPINREALDPENNIFPDRVVRGLRMSDAEFEAKRADYCLLLHALASMVYRARLEAGGRLNDATDFQQWLLQLARSMR